MRGVFQMPRGLNARFRARDAAFKEHFSARKPTKTGDFSRAKQPGNPAIFPGRSQLLLFDYTDRTPVSFVRHGNHITSHEPVDGHSEELVGDEAERAQHKKSDKHLSGRDDVRALHDEEADALVRGQHLRGYDAHEGKAQREPCPGQGPVRPRF